MSGPIFGTDPGGTGYPSTLIATSPTWKKETIKLCTADLRRGWEHLDHGTHLIEQIVGIHVALVDKELEEVTMGVDEHALEFSGLH